MQGQHSPARLRLSTSSAAGAESRRRVHLVHRRQSQYANAVHALDVAVVIVVIVG